MNNSKTNKPEISNFDLDDYLGKKKVEYVQTKVTDLVLPNQERDPLEPILPSEQTLPDKQVRKTNSTKQRKSSLQEYQNTFLIVPKITDRKTVFISNELRERIVDIVRKLGTEKSSVSGFIENLVICHLEEYKDDVESWKKL